MQYGKRLSVKSGDATIASRVATSANKYFDGSAFHCNATKVAPNPHNGSDIGRHEAESKNDAEPLFGPINIVEPFQYMYHDVFAGGDM